MEMAPRKMRMLPANHKMLEIGIGIAIAIGMSRVYGGHEKEKADTYIWQ
jgi:hypothetical protein